MYMVMKMQQQTTSGNKGVEVLENRAIDDDMISPRTSIPKFGTSLQNELQVLCKPTCILINLNIELDLDSPDLFDHDEISVDELKIFSIEQLVKNFSILCNNCWSLKTCQEKPNAGKQGDCDVISTESGNRKQKGGTKSNKIKKNLDDESYLAKADELLKIKQKQDEEKAAARLHSLNSVKGYMSVTQGGGPLSQRVERMKSLRKQSHQMFKIILLCGIKRLFFSLKCTITNKNGSRSTFSPLFFAS